ncbi:MAG TPA: hypothetical protein ENH82_11995 [bacterium]|nr:hypothetical protein [bacterium]
MREIKFRAWDKYAKKMIFDFVISQYNKFSGWSNCVYCGLKVGSGGSDDYTLMQYTGFKDKNGKEIYGGDILNGDFPDVVFWDDDRGQWMLRNSENPDDTLWEIIRDNNPEIISNVHEHPELLEKEEGK